MRKERKCGTRKKDGLYIYSIENDINQIELMIISCIQNTCKKNGKLKRTGFKEVCYLTNKQIADIVGLDERTVRTYINVLLDNHLLLENQLSDNYDSDIINIVNNNLVVEEEPRYLVISNNVKFSKTRFKGFMIPTNILESKELSISEKLVFGYLNAFDNKQLDCIAKTKTIQKICKIKSAQTINNIISKFKNVGLLTTKIEKGNKRIIKTNNINMVNFIANVSQTLQINKIDTLQIDNIENIAKVDNIEKIERVQNIHINMMDLSKVDLSKASREELYNMYKSAKNLVEIYRLALNAKVDK